MRAYSALLAMLVAGLLWISRPEAQPATEACGGPAQPMQGSRCQPPGSLQKSRRVIVEFAEPATVQKTCDAPACTLPGPPRLRVIVVANPCSQFLDPYALVLCHELGHAEGWPGDHTGGHLVPAEEWAAKPIYPVISAPAGAKWVGWDEVSPARAAIIWCAADAKTGSCIDGKGDPPK